MQIRRMTVVRELIDCEQMAFCDVYSLAGVMKGDAE